MAESDQKAAEKFNETLKRMLKTPPKPHDKPAKDKPAKPERESKKDRRTQQS